MACRQPEGPAGALRVARVLGAALVGLAAVVGGTGALVARASADDVSSAKAQVVALRSQALSVAREVHTWTARYKHDLAASARLRHEASQSRAYLGVLGRGLSQTRSLLQDEAVFAYANVLPSVGMLPPQPGDAEEELDRSTYQGVAVGHISDTLARFRGQASAVTVTLAGYQRRLKASLVAGRAALAARTAALRQAGALQELLVRANDHLARTQAAARAATGLPVGNGIVKAVTDSLGGAGPAPVLQAGSPIAGATTTSTAATSTAATSTAQTSTAQTSSTGAAPPLRTTASATPTSVKSPATSRTTTAISSASTRATATAPLTVPTTVLTKTVLTKTVLTKTVLTTTVLATTIVPGTTAVPTTTTVPTTTVPTTTTRVATTLPVTTTTGASADGGPHPAPLGGVWYELRECESGDNYQADTGNGYYGAYQFSWSTWSSLGFGGRPDLQPYWAQDQAAEELQARGGWGQWPACSAALGL